MAVTETRIVTKRLHERPDDSWTIDGALATGAYDALRAGARRWRPRTIVQEQVKTSGLRGRGGAGSDRPEVVVPARRTSFPRYLVVNGDEGEPSTFKDHMLVERDPHQLIEGIVISAYAIQCNHAFVYLRGEFALGYERLDAGDRRRVRRRASSARTSSARASTSRSSCTAARALHRGEETGLLSSLEGERGMPRIKPPFPAIAGLYAKPTVVNNVETLSTVPHIMRDGRRGVRQARRQPLDRHAHLLGLGPRRAARQLRGRARHHVPRPHLRPRRRRPRRQAARSSSSPAARRRSGCIDEHLDAPLDMDFVQQTLGDDARLGRGHGVRRDRRPAARRVAARQVLRARVVRQVHAVPRGHRLDREGALPHVARPRPARGPRPAARRSATTSRPGSTWPFAQTTICPLGPSTMSPVVSLDRFCRDEIIERMTRRHRAPRRARSDGRRMTHRRGADEPVAVGPPVRDPGRARARRRHRHHRRQRGAGAARRAAHQGRAGARHLHPALLLARAHEAGRHVPHVPRRGRGHARPPDRVHDAGRRRHGRAHAERRR